MPINPEKIEGNIATTPTGAKVNLTTGQLISGPTQSPSTNYATTPITSNTFAPSSALNVTPATVVPPPNVANLPITTPTLEAPKTPIPSNDFLKQLENLETTISGAKPAEEVKAGTAEQQRALNEINTQIRMHQANALAAQEKALQSGETLSFASGEAQRVAHNDAIEAIRLSALAQAAQGNLEIATTLTTQAINEKYKQMERDALTQRNNIINNYDSFTDDQKKQANALLLKLNNQDAFVAIQKQKEKDLQTIGNTAAANGAPLSLVQKAIATGDTIQANAILNQYVGTKGGQGAQGTINGVPADQIDVPSTIAKIKNTNLPSADLGGLTLNGLIQKAKTYMTNGGNVQGLGLGSTGNAGAQRTLIANYAGYLAAQAGLDIPQITALYKANAKATGEVISRIAKIDTTSATLTGQFPRLSELAGKVGNLGITEADLTAGKAAITRKFGSVDAGNYVELLQTVRADYAAMQSAIGGGRGGEFFVKTAQDAIPLGLTPEQYNGIAETIKISADIASQSSGAEVQKLIGGNTNTGNTVSFKDPKTGQIKSFIGLSADDIKDALSKGFIQQK